MRDDDLSRVVFLNEFEGNIGRDEVRAAMAERFNLGARALARLFAGPPVVVKSNLDAETALRYKLAIEATGARCRIETMPAEDDTDAHGYLDRREDERRRQPDRRDRTRTEAIVPDRRKGDRRGAESNVVVRMNAAPLTWSCDSICMRPAALDASSIAAEMYHRTCRVNFDAPGFCVLNAGQDIDSVAFRRLMVDLKREMATIHEESTGRTLAYLSAARFDQQETTRPHLDGGPDECFLMLGYEPSAIDSELEIADYARCAFDLGCSPKEFMAEHNPMFGSGYDILRPYTNRLACFSRTDYQIICINNSCSPWSDSRPAWQGTLHTATIPAADESERRVIDSTMIASVPAGTPDTINADELNEFITTSGVRRRGYGNMHREDDT